MLDISLPYFASPHLGNKGLSGEEDDVILTIDGAVGLLDVISAKFISIIHHRSLWGEGEWQHWVGGWVVVGGGGCIM